MSAYKKLKEAVLPYMDIYKTDITEHDRKTLHRFNGGFIHGARTTGTDMVRFRLSDYRYDLKILDFEQLLDNDKAFLLRDSNDLFHYYNSDNNLISITKEKAMELLDQWHDRVKKQYMIIQDLGVVHIGVELQMLMMEYGKRTWKSKVIDSNCPTLRRLRNYFDFDKIKYSADLNSITQNLYENIAFDNDDIVL
jgi:hypothetical protein